MEKHILSKSTFIKGHQCLKSLYLHKKRPFLRDKLSAEQLAKFKRGHKVGEMAQQLFPGGIDVSPKSPSQYQKSVIQTQELIAEGETIIYEATFQFNKVLVMLDILVKTEKGWEAYEVKSSRALSETYFTDAALQYYVITQSGLDLASFSLIYVNENYVQESEIDVQSYFIKQNVIAEIQKMQNQIENEIENELQILTEAHSPKIEVGAHCFDPYQCDFLGFCWKKKSSDIFKLPALSKVERTEMIDQGVLSITELKSHKWNNPLVNLQLESLFNEKPYVSSDLKDLLSTLPSDIVYLGFIARQAAIPQCAGHKSYQNQLLAYSFISSENSKNILFSGECNDYQAFIKHLIGHLSKAPQIVVYDKEYLAEILKQVAEFYPKLSSNIEQINNKILGIKQWIKDGQFYYPGIKHELLFKDVIKQVLNTNAYAKQSVYADVLAVNMYEQMLEKSSLFDEMDEGANAILAYVESLANYTKQIADTLRQ